MVSMPFEQVRRKEPRISLRTSGSIGINSAAMDHWFGDVDHVDLYHDSENEQLGLEPVEESGEHSFKINTTENSGSITPTDFMNRTELMPDQTTRYHVEWDDEHDMAVADLSTPTSYYGDEDGAES